ncbi:hypothetical protein DPMN_016723 [Dreissena polymorpha]|uniref:Uncharacterized protein n=1 Tax=Dreissena polymorpha TaxID=45954 RepID=A0A9D4NG59_DREPO|nr:hypothetical protein DPMN_016723 [Dreissena polymorpha]
MTKENHAPYIYSRLHALSSASGQISFQASQARLQLSMFVLHARQRISHGRQVPALLKAAWEQSVTLSNIIGGFSGCGIVPLNKHAVPITAFDPSRPTDVRIHQHNLQTPSQMASHSIHAEPTSFTCQSSLIGSQAQPIVHNEETLIATPLSSEPVIARFPQLGVR